LALINVMLYDPLYVNTPEISDRCFLARSYFKMIPVRFNVLLGFEPFDGAQDHEYVEGLQRPEFLMGFTL